MKKYFINIQWFKYYFLVLFIFASFNSFSINEFNKTEDKDEWQLYSEKNGVQIYYKTQECRIESQGLHQEYVLLKFVNTTDENLIVEWDNELWYNNVCRTCGSKTNEHHYEISLSSGDSVEGGCSLDSERKLRIFSKFLNLQSKSQLTKFELVNITIKK